MRPRLLASALCLLIAAIAPAAARAGSWSRANPFPWVNAVNRSLGFGWSDGYHAHGSRTSWTPAHRSPRHAAYPATIMYGTWPTLTPAPQDWYASGEELTPHLAVPTRDR